MLEVASELVAGEVLGLEKEWPDHQVHIRFREQGGNDWRLCFFASDAPNAVDSIMSVCGVRP